MHIITSMALLSFHFCVVIATVLTGLVSASEDEIDFSMHLLQSTVRLQSAIHTAGANFASPFDEPPSRSPGAFLSRHQCHHEPAVSLAFHHLDKAGVNMTPGFVDDLAKKFGFKIKIHNQTASMETFSGGADMMECHWWRNCDTWRYISLVKTLLSEVDLPDMEFVVRATDNVVGPLGALYSEGTPGEDLLLPGREFVYGQIGKSVRNRTGHQNCSSVHKGAVFRGTMTGTDWPNQNDSLPLLDTLGLPSPRYEAALLSKRRPDLLDAGFVGTERAEKNPNIVEQLKTEGLQKDFLDDEEQRCYEAIVVIDGASLADRLPNQLAYGIPLILVRNRLGLSGQKVTEEFWYPEMVNGEHYFSATPESLETVLGDVLSLPATTRAEVGERGRQFVQNRLSDDRILCYMFNLLSEYAARFHD